MSHHQQQHHHQFNVPFRSPATESTANNYRHGGAGTADSLTEFSNNSNTQGGIRDVQIHKSKFGKETRVETELQSCGPATDLNINIIMDSDSNVSNAVGNSLEYESQDLQPPSDETPTPGEGGTDAAATSAAGIERANFSGSLLLTLELYHAIGHMFILFRFRLLPRCDLVRQRLYFLADTATVLLVRLYLGRLYWWQDAYTAVQMAQHLFYFATWESSFLARRVVSWSSLDWQQQKPGSQQAATAAWLEVFGTSFDVGVHLVNAFLLVHALSTVEVVLCLALTQCLVLLVLFNPLLAWSSPTRIPDWVSRRLAPIPSHSVGPAE